MADVSSYTELFKCNIQYLVLNFFHKKSSLTLNSHSEVFVSNAIHVVTNETKGKINRTVIFKRWLVF